MPDGDFPRLIEHAFPLKQASLDSVHEKNVRHGHISTLHIWPARRPLAACRAALIATLLPDPGDPEKRRELCEKIGGRVVKKIERKKLPNGQTVERIKEVTEGGILHWGRETENGETLQWFREEIRNVYGGRAPKVLEEMRSNIAAKLRDFWDAGIRGPDFVWAATGPAMEADSKHPVVRKANEPNATMGVGEFLNHVRRMVVDYVVGQVLTGEKGSDLAVADRLDEVTAYYLLHRHDFGLDEAPVGACILYATACGLSDAELDRTWDILARTGADSSADDDNDADEDDGGDGDNEPADEPSGGSKVKLRAWNQRRGKSMGCEAPQGKAVPLIDRIHRVMHLWREGDLQKVDEYLDQHALRRNELFKRVVQSLIELSSNSERAILESISNHIGAKGARLVEARPLPGMESIAESEDE